MYVSRRGPVTAALILAAATASSVYCQTPTRPDDQAIAAEAGGWRLVVTRPVAGTTTRSEVLFCYEVSGTAREADLALEITPLRRSGGPAADPVVTAIAVGRSSATADLSAAGEGTFDLRVQLVVNGSRADRPSVVIPEMTVRQNAPPGTCP